MTPRTGPTNMNPNPSLRSRATRTLVVAALSVLLIALFAAFSGSQSLAPPQADTGAPAIAPLAEGQSAYVRAATAPSEVAQSANRVHAFTRSDAYISAVVNALESSSAAARLLDDPRLYFERSGASLPAGMQLTAQSGSNRAGVHEFCISIGIPDWGLGAKYCYTSLPDEDEDEDDDDEDTERA